MGIVNRRNAVVGWATWNVFKQILKRNAKAEAAKADAEPKSSKRLRRKERRREAQAEPKRKRGKRRVLGALVATGIGVGAWLGSRGRKPQGDELE